jgi:hypothetical protein
MSTMGIGSTLNSGTLVAGGTTTGEPCRDGADEKGQYASRTPSCSWTNAPSVVLGVAPVERGRLDRRATPCAPRHGQPMN